MKNPNRLLRKLRTFANANIRDILNNQHQSILYPVPKKYLPVNTYLRDLYNQAYYCLYANMGDASLALSCVCLEKISRDFYSKFIGSRPVTWNQVLEQLIKHFKGKKENEENKAFLILLNDVLERKDRIRNLLLHGKIDEFILDTKLEHKAFNVLTGQYENIQLNYDERIHGKKKSRIKHEKVNLMAHDTLCLLSITIIRFNKHIDLQSLKDEDNRLITTNK
ncbi:MAG: hypothetical protein QW165_02655 [Candidatus Woesearchaeota archaeon]